MVVFIRGFLTTLSLCVISENLIPIPIKRGPKTLEKNYFMYDPLNLMKTQHD